MAIAFVNRHNGIIQPRRLYLAGRAIAASTLPIAPERELSEQHEFVPLFRVVLLDDNDHTYDYVIEMLQKIFVFTVEQAYRHAEEVDRCGRTVLITCELAQAEFARDQIQSYGPDPRLPRSKGSMSAVIEPCGVTGP